MKLETRKKIETQKKQKKANITNPPNTKMNQEHDITALIYNGLRRAVVDTQQQANALHDHVQKNTAKMKIKYL